MTATEYAQPYFLKAVRSNAYGVTIPKQFHQNNSLRFTLISVSAAENAPPYALVIY